MVNLPPLRNLADGSGVELIPGLTFFRVPKARFRRGQSYALTHNGKTVLVDAVHAITREAVDELSARHPRPAALLITHSDLLKQAFGPPAELSKWLDGAPVLINSYDAMGYDGLHPVESNTPLLEELGFSYHHVPGHTAGSTAYLHMPTGYLFTGDIIVGNNYENEQQRFTHPPIAENDYELNAAGWANIPAHGVKAVLPLHGQPSFGEDAYLEARAAGVDKHNVMRE